MKDELDEIIARIQAGSIESAALDSAKRGQVETIRVDPQHWNNSDAVDIAQKMWAEVGRTHTQFIQTMSIDGTPDVKIFFQIPNAWLRMFSSLAELTCNYEASRIPPGMVDAEDIIKMLVTRYIETYNGVIPDDVKDGLRILIKDQVPSWGRMMNRYR